ncbi:MAG: hypothetical protein QOK71_07685, partial [Nitrososphaeraceae archaeon]|nr:hypothetical protein [Nitrososphaeraceae archaeon]
DVIPIFGRSVGILSREIPWIGKPSMEMGVEIAMKDSIFIDQNINTVTSTKTKNNLCSDRPYYLYFYFI